jgi:hypothetical protein
MFEKTKGQKLSIADAKEVVNEVVDWADLV